MRLFGSAENERTFTEAEIREDLVRLGFDTADSTEEQTLFGMWRALRRASEALDGLSTDEPIRATLARTHERYLPAPDDRRLEALIEIVAHANIMERHASVMALWLGGTHAGQLRLPHWTKIADFEVQLVDKVESLMAQGRSPFVQWAAEVGLTKLEQTSLVRMARAQLVDWYSRSPEEARAEALHRLDNIAVRARDSLNLSVELQAMKAATTVEGLTHTPPQSDMDEVIKIVEHGTRDEDQLELGSTQVDEPLPSSRRPASLPPPKST